MIPLDRFHKVLTACTALARDPLGVVIFELDTFKMTASNGHSLLTVNFHTQVGTGSYGLTLEECSRLAVLPPEGNLMVTDGITFIAGVGPTVVTIPTTYSIKDYVDYHKLLGDREKYRKDTKAYIDPMQLLSVVQPFVDDIEGINIDVTGPSSPVYLDFRTMDEMLTIKAMVMPLES